MFFGIALIVYRRRERDWVLGEFKAGRSPILIVLLPFADSAPKGARAYADEADKFGAANATRLPSNA